MASLIKPSRRSFIVGFAAVLAAPAIISHSSLMQLRGEKLILPRTVILMIGALDPTYIKEETSVLAIFLFDVKTGRLSLPL